MSTGHHLRRLILVCLSLVLALPLVARAAEGPTVRVATRPIDGLSGSPMLGDMQWSTAGAETEPGSEEYPHIFSTDVWNPRSFWYTNRPNILNIPVDEKWDPMKLINTDRPDFTDVATVVGKGVKQLETGYSYHRRVQSDAAYDIQTVPESLLRIGQSDHFEWRIKWDNGYTHMKAHDTATGATADLSGYSDVQLGFKWVMVDQDDWLPMQSIVTRFIVPAGNRNFSADTVQPGLSYIYNYQVRRWWFCRGATHIDVLNKPGPVFNSVPFPYTTYTVERDSQIQGAQSFSSYVQISPRIGMYTEWFVLLHSGSSDDRPDHYQNYGCYFYLTPNFQLDLRITARLGNGDVSEYFTGAGLSYRWQ